MPTTPLGIEYPVTTDPVRIAYYLERVAVTADEAIEDKVGGLPTVAAATLLKTIVPGSGSQVVFNMSGWAAPPTTAITLEHGTYAYIWTIRAVTATQGNVYVTHHDNTPLPDSWALHLHIVAVGVAAAGQTPTLT